MTNQIGKAYRFIKRKVLTWMIVHKIGRVAEKYHSLTQQVERNAFLAEHLGRSYMLAKYEIEEAANDRPSSQ